MNKAKDPFLSKWELDLTPRKAKELNLTDSKKQSSVEKSVSDYIRNNFSFAVFPVENKEKRLELESKIISTVSLCEECRPSKNWLGLFSPKEKIKKSGLWLVNELWKTPLNEEELWELKNLCHVKK